MIRSGNTPLLAILLPVLLVTRVNYTAYLGERGEFALSLIRGGTASRAGGMRMPRTVLG